MARRQLLAGGICGWRIDRWVADGRLRVVYRGVYAVGHEAESLHADYMAAVLAGGEVAVLSHHAAAHLMGLVRRRPQRPELTVASSAGRKQDGLVVHRVPALDRLDAAIFERIPITIVPRVLIDIAPSTPPAQLTRACHEAWVKHRTGPREIEACIERNPRKRGIRKLRTALGADLLLSDLESAFLRLLSDHGLPLPRTNIDRQGDKVDCHWPALNLTIELMSFRFHASRHAFERDVARRRRSSHVAYTYGDVFERPAETLADLRRRLA